MADDLRMALEELVSKAQLNQDEDSKLPCQLKPQSTEEMRVAAW